MFAEEMKVPPHALLNGRRLFQTKTAAPTTVLILQVMEPPTDKNWRTLWALYKILPEKKETPALTPGFLFV